MLSRRAPLLLCLLAWLLLPAAGFAQFQQPTFLFDFGGSPSLGPGDMKFNTSLAVNTGTGEVYVGDDSNRIQRFDADGVYIGEWACNGCDSSLAVNEATDELYVARASANKIERYSAAGVFVGAWGSAGSADGEFDSPWSLSIDQVTGNVYVMDRGNARVQVFDSTGTFLFKFGSQGNALGQFSGRKDPYGIDLDPASQRVYVCEAPRERVNVFAYDGTPIFSFAGVEGTLPGQMRWSRNLAVAPNGNIYITDTDNERIQIFDPTGAHVGFMEGPHGVAEGGPFHPRAVAFNLASGRKYVNASYSDRVDIFDGSDGYLSSFGSSVADQPKLWFPRNAVVSPITGDVFVFDSFQFRLKRFSAGGQLIQQWGVARQADPSSMLTFGPIENALHFTDDGTLWMGKTGLHYPGGKVTAPGVIAPFVGRMTEDGTVLGTWIRGDLDTKFTESIKGIARDPATGKVWVSDFREDRLVAYDLGTEPDDVAELLEIPVTRPVGLALRDGHVYALDTTNDKVVKYALDGTFVAEFGEGELNVNAYASMTFDADGNLYVADPGNNRIRVYDGDGAPLGEIRTTPGGMAPTLANPFAVGFSPVLNMLYVTDTGRDRVAAFSLGAACADGRDNDGDLATDFPADTGCLSAADLSEQPDCQDGLDNDGDGSFDAGDDPGCANSAWPTEGPDDTDLDGHVNADDNCPSDANADQRDTNEDGFGNLCDADYNDDGAVGIGDFNILRGQFGNTDADPGFDPDVDCDGDGAIGIADFNCLRQSFGGPPG